MNVSPKLVYPMGPGMEITAVATAISAVNSASIAMRLVVKYSFILLLEYPAEDILFGFF